MNFIKVLLAMILLLAGCFFNIISLGEETVTYWDLPSFILAIILPTIIQIVIYGGQNTRIAFSAVFKKISDYHHLVAGRRFFRSFQKTVWLVSLIVFLISLINFAKEYYSFDVPNIYFAVLLIPVLYTPILSVLIFICNLLIEAKLYNMR
jgi:hypothetical protein